MQELGLRKAELKDMQNDGRGRVRLEYRVPARGLIGFQGEFMNLTRGNGLISHIFDGFAPLRGDIPERRNGVLISTSRAMRWPMRCGTSRSAAGCSSIPAKSSTKA